LLATMLRWLLLPLGLAVAGAAGYLLLASPAPEEPSAPSRPAASAQPPKAAARPGKPMGEIDDASRRQLEGVLEGEGLGR
jgi:hypothetical protein